MGRNDGILGRRNNKKKRQEGQPMICIRYVLENKEKYNTIYTYAHYDMKLVSRYEE